ncbi:MAG: DUF167 domain-containing protein [bacterium]
MKILATVKPNAKEPRIKKTGDATFSVWVKEPARDGKANQAVIKALAQYFGVAPQKVRILIGQTSRQKIIAINK